MSIRKAVIPAAGLGTRFLPATKAMPKEMLPIIDTPAIQFIVEEAVEAGIEEILIITGKGKRSIEDHFDAAIELEQHLERLGKYDLYHKVRKTSKFENIFYVRQKEPKGLGHAIWCARHFIKDEPFAVLLGDSIFEDGAAGLRQLIEDYEQLKAPIIGIQSVARESVSKYGIIEGKPLQDNLHVIEKFIEKPQPSQVTSTSAMVGRYILTPEIFTLLEKIEAGINNEIQLTDAIAKLGEIKNIYAREFQGIWHDVGEHLGYVKAVLSYGMRRNDMRDAIKDYIANFLEGEK